MDRLQILVERNRGKRLYDGYVNTCDFAKTRESSTIVPLHSAQLAATVQALTLPANLKLDSPEMCSSWQAVTTSSFPFSL